MRVVRVCAGAGLMECFLLLIGVFCPGDVAAITISLHLLVKQFKYINYNIDGFRSFFSLYSILKTNLLGFYFFFPVHDII